MDDTPPAASVYQIHCLGDYSRASTRMTCVAPHEPAPRAVGMPCALSPSAMACSDVAPASCSVLIVGAISVARCAARSWRTRTAAARALGDPLARGRGVLVERGAEVGP